LSLSAAARRKKLFTVEKTHDSLPTAKALFGEPLWERLKESAPIQPQLAVDLKHPLSRDSELSGFKALCPNHLCGALFIQQGSPGKTLSRCL
jgi:hypothetical protein